MTACSMGNAAAYWQSEQGREKNETQSAVDVSMFLTCGAQKTSSQHFYKLKDLSQYFFSLQRKIFVC